MIVYFDYKNKKNIIVDIIYIKIMWIIFLNGLFFGIENY